MGEKVLPRGGLLSGGIGGAAQGILDVAKLSLEERAQTRKDDLAAKVALYKASQKKTGSGDDKPKIDYTTIDKYDESGAKIGEEEKVWDESNRRLLTAYTDDALNPYLDDISMWHSQYNMTPTEIARELERQGKAKDPNFKLPPGLVEFGIFRHQIPQGGTKPPVKPKPTTPVAPERVSAVELKRQEDTKRKAEAEAAGKKIGQAEGYENLGNM